MMKIQRVLLSIDWPAVFCFFAHVLSASSLPAMTKLLISHLHFPYPATLAFIHSATVAICLWYWTILNIFKPRSIPLRTLIPLSLSSAVNTLLHSYALAMSSLLHFQLVRLLPLVSLRPNADSAPLLIGIAVLFLTHPPSMPAAFILMATVIASTFDSHGPLANLRRTTRGTELQLQLLVRSTSAVMIGVMVPFLDDFSADSGFIAGLVGIEDPTSLFLYSTGLLAFFSFASVRVSHSKLGPYAFRVASVLGTAPMFIIHFLIYEWPSTLDIAAVILVLAGTYHLTVSSLLNSRPDDDDNSSVSSTSEGDVSPRYLLSPFSISSSTSSASHRSGHLTWNVPEQLTLL